MLSPRLSECIECSNISALLCDIDHKLADLAKIQYNNIVFALNKTFPGEVVGDLLNYKRILMYRACNCDYAGCFSVNQISSKIKILYPNCKCATKKSTTTTSTTTSNLTTTSTTSTPISTTTSTSTSPLSGCGCYNISVPGAESSAPLTYIPCGGGPVQTLKGQTNKYCVSSIISLGSGTATPIVGSSCATDNDCRPCRCYQITYNNIANTLISYVDCNGFSVVDRLITQNTRLCAKEDSIAYINVGDITVVDVSDCANCPITPPATGGPFSINWVTTVNNPCDSSPWTINPNNLVVRYDVTDSLNCGGTCDSIQAGTAIATIQTGPVNLNLTITVTGLAELQLAGFERLPIVIDGMELQTYMSAGGLLGCVMGAPNSVTYTPGPYAFLAGSAHTVEIDFSTLDKNYHLGAYYEITLAFT